MRTPRQLGILVGSQRQSSPAASHPRGFTLLEIQIAIVLLSVAMIGMVGQGRAYRALLETVETQHRFEGVALAADDRIVLTVTDAGRSAGAPACQVALESIEDLAGTIAAEVVITRRLP